MQTPLQLTRSPRLDNALRFGWESFRRTLAAAGAGEASRWIAMRLDDPESAEVTEPLLRAALGDDAEEAADALFGLAELAEEADDDLLADTLWEGVLDLGRAQEDGDVIAEATRRLATVAERNGDPLAAAEFHIGFLNWRREANHSSDPEDVELAFDEIIRLAESDGAPRPAAEYAFRQAEFTRLLDQEDPSTVEGNWDERSPEYASWA
ncbi:MAG: hypothetical protein U0031_14620 [Thermomicrobiales bacterium]